MRLPLSAMLWLSGSIAFAQQPAAPSAAPQPTPASPPIAMTEPQPGDHWTYEFRDEISGKVTDKRTDTVTEVTPTAIAIRYLNEKDKTGFSVYDRNWNAKTADTMKYTPTSALGVVQPLKVGASWPIKVQQTNTEKGLSWRWTGQSKVSAEEKITTKAGTFDTFRIEATYTVSPVNNPAQKSEAVVRTWYAPAIDHFVLRTNTIRTDNLLRVNTRVELVAYGRKE